MKKLFGVKKKKKSKPASFNSADSDFQVKDVVPRRLIMSQSTDQPRLAVTNGINNNSTISNTINNSKGLMHSKSQGIMKTTIPTQPAMTKRLNRPTSSPPALVMPRPRYAEPPTRAVLKSFEHEKTLLDSEGHKPNGMIKPPIPISSLSTPSHQLPPIAADHDNKPTIRNKKSLDSGIVAVLNAKKHESLNSITSSDDSNRVYESALESPMMTSSTTTTNMTESIFAQTTQPVHGLVPPTASDSSETVTPAGSTSVYVDQPVVRPLPTSAQTSQPITSPPIPSQDLESLQQQVLLIQQQREMDRVEYERMEQVHKERTKWMKEEINRTQDKLMKLTAAKRPCLPEDGQGDPNVLQQPYEQHSSANSTPSRSQKSGIMRMSRSSSKTSNGGRSSGSKGDEMLPREMVNDQDTMDPSAYPIGSGNVSRQSSGRKSQQSRHRYQQESQQPSTSRPREQRPRSKSTESRIPPLIEPEEYAYDEMPPGRPNNNRRRYQRSASVERPVPYYYDMPYFYPPYEDMDAGELEIDDDDEHDDYRYMDYRQQQQQRHDSFPSRHRQPMRQYYPQPPYMMPPMQAGPYTNRHPRMEQDFYGFDGPYYPSRRRPSQPMAPPGMIPNDDGYWGGVNRYPPAVPSYMRMDDPQRRYWRNRPPPPTEYGM